jgi:mycothiol synthase
MHYPLNMASQITIYRCDPSQEKTALGLAAQAWPEAERAGYWKSISDCIRTGQAEQVVLVAAREDDPLLAAQVGQLLPGRAAVVWAPQFLTTIQRANKSVAAEMFQQLTSHLSAGGAHLAQALISSEDATVADMFSLGGFSHAANLLYLTVELNGELPKPALPFELETYAPHTAARLIEVIEGTYAGTLDCPRIDGLRRTADVIVGYQAVGQFRPDLWSIVSHEGLDVGCLLMNVHPDVQHVEIVYLALAPEVRGRGWGQLLTQQALWLAHQTQSQRVVLAVDAANQPAIDIYLKSGFSIFDRRAVWIKSLV